MFDTGAYRVVEPGGGIASGNRRREGPSSGKLNELIRFNGMWIVKFGNGSIVVEKYGNMSGRLIRAFKEAFIKLNDFVGSSGEFTTGFNTST